MRISVAEFRKQLAEVISRVLYDGERIVLERYGRPVATIIPWVDDERQARSTERRQGETSHHDRSPIDDNPISPNELQRRLDEQFRELARHIEQEIKAMQPEMDAWLRKYKADGLFDDAPNGWGRAAR